MRFSIRRIPPRIAHLGFPRWLDQQSVGCDHRLAVDRYVRRPYGQDLRTRQQPFIWCNGGALCRARTRNGRFVGYRVRSLTTNGRIAHCSLHRAGRKFQSAIQHPVSSAHKRAAYRIYVAGNRRRVLDSIPSNLPSPQTQNSLTQFALKFRTFASTALST